MKSHKFDAEILDTDIKIKRDKERVEEITFDYHNDLLQLLEYKTRGDGDSGNKTHALFHKVIESFGSIVAIQKRMIEDSMELAKLQLQRAFDLSGIDTKYLSDKMEENGDERKQKQYSDYRRFTQQTKEKSTK